MTKSIIDKSGTIANLCRVMISEISKQKPTVFGILSDERDEYNLSLEKLHDKGILVTRGTHNPWIEEMYNLPLPKFRIDSFPYVTCNDQHLYEGIDFTLHEDLITFRANLVGNFSISYKSPTYKNTSWKDNYYIKEKPKTKPSNLLLGLDNKL